MANTKVQSNVRNMMYNGRNSLLPPKCPFSSIPPSYGDYIPTSTIAPKSLPKPRGGYHHQRTSSESFLVEEQPSWLDELLSEPESPVRRGHRRSSSDSFAYCDGNVNFVAQDDSRFKNLIPVPAWGSRELEIYRNIQQSAFYPGATHAKTKNGLPSPRDNAVLLNGGPLSNLKDADRNIYSCAERQNLVESCAQDMKGSEKKDTCQAKYAETDTKRAKQQFAQRSRVRKLQYIAELERHVHVLQTEGSEASAELEFLNQQHLILNMENKALRQRLENLSQEQLIKCLEHEVLEREVVRLRNLYNQQQQQQQQPHPQHKMLSNHRRVNSNDLDQQFASLALKPKVEHLA